MHTERERYSENEEYTQAREGHTARYSVRVSDAHRYTAQGREEDGYSDSTVTAHSDGTV